MPHAPHYSDSSSLPEDRIVLTGEVNFTIMYAAHDAFARDLRRLMTACSTGSTSSPDIATTWTVFKSQLQTHHRAEDVALWPQLRGAVTAPDALAVLDAMDAEHAHIDPGIDAVDSALAGGDRAGLTEALGRVSADLGMHMRHEENAALPLVEAHLGPAGWAVFTRHIRQMQGLRGGAVFFP